MEYQCPVYVDPSRMSTIASKCFLIVGVNRTYRKDWLAAGVIWFIAVYLPKHDIKYYEC